MELIGLLIIGALLRILFLLGMERLIKPEKLHKNSILRLVRPDKQHKREWKIAIRNVFLDTIFLYTFIAVAHGINIAGKLDPWQCAVGLVGHSLTFELMAYWYHRTEHRFPRLCPWHGKHHSSVIPTPLTSLMFSMSERVFSFMMFVFPMFVFSQVFGAFPLWLLAVVVALHDGVNSLVHCNREFTPAVLRNSFFARYIFSPTHHARHHAGVQGNYGLFVPLYDQIFGTYVKDAVSLEKRTSGAD